MANSGETRQKRHRQSTWPPEVMTRIKDLALEAPDSSAKVVAEQLKEEGFKDVPSERTLRDMLKEFRPPKPTDIWSLAKASDEEAALVLPVLREVVDRTGGQVASFSTAMAQQIAKIRRLIPEEFWPTTLITFWDVYALAAEYIVAEERKQPPTGPDAYLAFAPWRGLWEVMRYEQAVREGRIAPRLLPLEIKELYAAEADRAEEEREELRKREGYDVDENHDEGSDYQETETAGG